MAERWRARLRRYGGKPGRPVAEDRETRAALDELIRPKLKARYREILAEVRREAKAQGVKIDGRQVTLDRMLMQHGAELGVKKRGELEHLLNARQKDLIKK